ncbi:uncharacterized protein HMPREF1541_03904 [Cyphellophora europaea CBS 101466]|uniref:Myb-like DNA-binding domain-containing protein n=1 Tax=Cyphellophora europaea (strain CBS 101466) TaxID=1220924 RepID=W2S049_CYPE1|nr:uncharacterized protein HMPREF1541_03904 [Cyphellophora europaea CBS 101466]ETN41965.1 hypothetical protein HMPREF1541_03904 [Cyphellophora europaea CBS 101466]
MSSKPVSEAAYFLYQCINHGGTKLDFKLIGEALDLKTGTANMRYTRFRERINKAGVVQGRAWSGQLNDADAVFLFQCIRACDIKVDFNAVGDALGLKAGTAHMRYTRLRHKYDEIDSSAGAAPSAAVSAPPSPNVSVSEPTEKAEDDVAKKRKAATSDESGNDTKRATPKKQKVDAKAAPDKIKIEEEPAVEKRQTRGKKIDLAESLDSDDDSAAIPSTDGAKDSFSDDYEPHDTDSDYILSDEDTPKAAVVGRRRVPGSTRSSVQKVIKRRLQHTPAGLSGVKMWQTSKTVRHAAKQTIPAPVKAVPTPPKAFAVPAASVATTPTLRIPDDREATATSDASNESVTPSYHALQLQHDLITTTSATPPGEETVLPSVEAIEDKSPGLLTRFVSWWK